jgi:flagellar hook-basal body complex protein FliE
MSIAAIGGVSSAINTQSTASATQSVGGGDFGASLDAALSNVNQAQQSADVALAELGSGSSVDLHGTMMKLQQADITMRTMVSVRDKVVDAYQQIMNMSI